MLNRIISLILTICMSISVMSVAFAAHLPNSDIDSSVLLEDDRIFERNTLTLNGVSIIVERETHSDNTSHTIVTENGVVTADFVTDVNYEALLKTLTGASPASNAPAAAYTNRFLVTKEYVEYYGPDVPTTFSDILSWVSIALGAFNLPGSTLTGIASLIVNQIEDMTYAPTDMRIINTVDWYEQYDAGGGFICYYGECTIVTEIQDENGDWLETDTTYADFESLMVF